MRRILLAAAAAFLTMFVLGGTWNAVVMARFYVNPAPVNARLPEEQSFFALIVGYGFTSGNNNVTGVIAAATQMSV